MTTPQRIARWAGFALAATLGLASCQSLTPAEAAARRAAIEAEQDAECRGYGALPGSDAYVDCRLRLNEMAQAERIERRRDAAIRSTAPPFVSPFIVQQPLLIAPAREDCVRYGRIVECRTY